MFSAQLQVTCGGCSVLWVSSDVGGVGGEAGSSAWSRAVAGWRGCNLCTHNWVAGSDRESVLGATDTAPVTEKDSSWTTHSSISYRKFSCIIILWDHHCISNSWLHRFFYGLFIFGHFIKLAHKRGPSHILWKNQAPFVGWWMNEYRYCCSHFNEVSSEKYIAWRNM